MKEKIIQILNICALGFGMVFIGNVLWALLVIRVDGKAVIVEPNIFALNAEIVATIVILILFLYAFMLNVKRLYRR